MGSYLSRQLNNAGVEEDTDSANNLKYKYPPKTGRRSEKNAKYVCH
jgi:hypothetical protein